MGKIIRIFLAFWLSVCLILFLSACGSGGSSDVSSVPPPAASNGGISDITSDIPQTVRDIVIKNAPTLVLHKDEKYFPTTIDLFMSNSLGLYDSHNKSISSQPTRALLYEGYDGSYIKAPETDGFKNGMDKTKAKEWPAYIWVAKVTINDHQDHEYFIAKYNMFYPYNTLSTTDFDKHYGDWEAITVLFDHDTSAKTLKSALVERTHRYDPTLVSSPSTITKNGAGYKAYKAWVSLHSHGTHGNTNCAFSGDACDDQGSKWDMSITPYEYVQYKELEYDTVAGLQGNILSKSDYTHYTVDWAHFKGRWGQSSNNGWDEGDSPETNVTVHMDTGTNNVLKCLGDAIAAEGNKDVKTKYFQISIPWPPK